MPLDKEVLVNIVSGHGLVPDGTKPLPDSILIYQDPQRKDLTMLTAFMFSFQVDFICYQHRVASLIEAE